MKEAVERMAEAFWTGGPHSRPWKQLTEHERNLLRARTQAAIEAGRAAGLQIAAADTEEDAA